MQSSSNTMNLPVICRRTIAFTAVALNCCLTTVKTSAQTFAEWTATPPMGWNSWDCYGSSVTEKEVRANAAFMAEHLRAYGWEYVVIDIRWYVENPNTPPDRPYNQRDAKFWYDKNGILVPPFNRFPSAKGEDGENLGFKPLADHLHGKGLKLGVHLMRGINKQVWERDLPIADSDFTARDIERAVGGDGKVDGGATWLRDNYGMVKSEAAQAYYDAMFAKYAQWGVDYIKVDDMLRDYSRPDDSYYADEIEMIHAAIDKSGRPMVLSLSPGGAPLAEAEHLGSHANLWRITNDLWDEWEDVHVMFDRAKEWTPYRGLGRWPDNDMLPLGRLAIRGERGEFNRDSKLTRPEQRTLMSLWFISRSPLMYGGDLPHIASTGDDFTLSLMNNPEAIAVNQASTNNRELSRSRSGHEIVWVADAEGEHEGAHYVGLFNRDTDSARSVSVLLEELGYSSQDSVSVRDLWERRDLDAVSGGSIVTLEVPAHGSRLIRLSKDVDVLTQHGN